MTSGDVPEMRLRTGSPPTLEPAACCEPASAWDTPIFEAKELNLDRGVVISCSAHTSQDSGIVGADFRSCGTRETAQYNTVKELSERGRRSGCALDTCFELFKFRAFLMWRSVSAFRRARCASSSFERTICTTCHDTLHSTSACILLVSQRA